MQANLLYVLMHTFAKWSLLLVYYYVFTSVPTCTHSQLCRSSSVQCSWVYPPFHTSSWAQWSAFDALHRLCPYMGRRAAHVYNQQEHGQRTCAGPYCIWAGCTGLTWQWVWYKPRHILCGASGTSRPHCKPWLHPGSDSQLSCQHQSLWTEVRLVTRFQQKTNREVLCVCEWEHKHVLVYQFILMRCNLLLLKHQIRSLELNIRFKEEVCVCKQKMGDLFLTIRKTKGASDEESGLQCFEHSTMS